MAIKEIIAKLQKKHGALPPCLFVDPVPRQVLSDAVEEIIAILGYRLEDLVAISLDGISRQTMPGLLKKAIDHPGPLLLEHIDLAPREVLIRFLSAECLGPACRLVLATAVHSNRPGLWSELARIARFEIIHFS